MLPDRIYWTCCLIDSMFIRSTVEILEYVTCYDEDGHVFPHRWHVIPGLLLDNWDICMSLGMEIGCWLLHWWWCFGFVVYGTVSSSLIGIFKYKLINRDVNLWFSKPLGWHMRFTSLNSVKWSYWMLSQKLISSDVSLWFYQWIELWPDRPIKNHVYLGRSCNGARKFCQHQPTMKVSC